MTILQERKYRLPLENNNSRRRYLEKIITGLNNELVDSSLTPLDRSRLYTAILTALKTVHEISCDAKLEELEKRIAELEKRKEEKL